MRIAACVLAAGALLASPPALGNSFTFGSPIDNSTLNTNSGNSNSKDNERSISVGATSATITAQVSGDQGNTTQPTVIQDLTVSYAIPFTVTRNVTIDSSGGPPLATFPLQQITFDLSYSGRAAAGSPDVGPGLQKAWANPADGSAGLESLSGSLPGDLDGASRAGNNADGSTGFSNSGSFSLGPTSVNLAGPEWDEATTDANGIPSIYVAWNDFESPSQANYSNDPSFTQSASGTLNVAFNLRAESRASGSVSTTGGEAMACVGDSSSSLGSFSLDDGINCGSGLQIGATSSVVGSVVQAVPEPSSMLLIGAGLAGLGVWGSRRFRA